MDDEMGEVIAEVGGPVDECGVCLAIYGEDLDPDELTRVLACRPTRSHRRGDKKGERSRPAAMGAWILEFRGEPPDTPDVLTRKVVMSVPADRSLWDQLKKRFDIQIRYGIHMTGWNKGMSLPADIVSWISLLGASVEFDIYAYEEDDGT
jgi:hypothetical protein